MRPVEITRLFAERSLHVLLTHLVGDASRDRCIRRVRFRPAHRKNATDSIAKSVIQTHADRVDNLVVIAIPDESPGCDWAGKRCDLAAKINVEVFELRGDVTEYEVLKARAGRPSG